MRSKVRYRSVAILVAATALAAFASEAANSTATTATTAPAVSTSPATTTPATTSPATTASTAPKAALPPLKTVTLETVAEGLVEPVDVAAPQADGLLFVVERAGIVRLIEGGRIAKEPFANIKKTIKSASIEQGLLGIAFHPNYPTDRRVFFFHSKKDNDNVLVSYQVAADGRRIDPASRVEIITIDKTPEAVRHNGGALRFGPDSFLYISVGDAAKASVNGQNPKTLPGSILRIDINATGTSKQAYGIPPGNPFADGKDGRPEVWWYGLRNPWRFSIDATSGLAYIADVGQELFEEINVVPHTSPGLNFGWPLFEANRRFYTGTPATPVVAPVVQVRHDDVDGGCSITGGEVYRGKAIPELDGHYFYADWCLGWIRSFRFDGKAVLNRKDWSKQLSTTMVSSFGHDANGELLVIDYESGTVSRLKPVR